MSDEQTIKVYNAQADAYDTMMRDYAANDPLIHEFIATCPANGFVLDLGCGPGGYAVLMAQAGLKIDALDASAEIISRIPDLADIYPRKGRFDDITGENIYDGIWASFSLLHAPRKDMPRHLAALRRALKPDGNLFIGMKMGVGNERDDLGRYYEYYSKPELETLLKNACFTPTQHWTGQAKGLDETYHGWIVVCANA
ncbi:class I SAM-dependent methyltransferase [Sulfitobacter sp. F26169L]|uniref:class I SAM-dependent DNA methyltransferase n=1 Tax=Sulfitobacter sp. F26169L TaxID=2996015 RepID=UPI00226102B1|nr:class I SAM-dependent methyltransferase [Sulfitobacter sp. F26169L]MCX7566759.1 class I SAM-dependent methyltransferase [Sulfitobacter sp. F26169L]